MDGEQRLIGRSGRGALLAFLLFLAFPVADLATSPPAGLHLALVAAGAVVFVAVYVGVMWTPTRRLRRRDRAAFVVLLAVALALGLDNSAEVGAALHLSGRRLRLPPASACRAPRDRGLRRPRGRRRARGRPSGYSRVLVRALLGRRRAAAAGLRAALGGERRADGGARGEGAPRDRGGAAPLCARPA